MASFSSLGIGSGLDLNTLVGNLVSAERAASDYSLFNRQSNASTELSGVGLMRSALAGFQESYGAFENIDNFNYRKVSNSNPSALTVSTSNEAALASYTIDINQLATVHSVASSAYTSIDETVGEGVMKITFGTITSGATAFDSFAANADSTIQTITIDSTNNTLSGLKDYINAGDYGVAAAIVNDGSGFRLTLTGEETGASQGMEITITDTDGNSTDTIGLSALSYNASTQNLTQTQAAQNALIDVNGLSITGTSNTLTDVIEDVTLTLNSVMDAGEEAVVAVTEDTDEVSNAILDLVEGFNNMITTLDELGTSDPDTNTIGLLAGDATLRSFKAQVRSLITDTVDGLTGNVTALIDLGISTQSDGTLSIDKEIFEAAVSENPFDALALFAPVGKSTDSLIDYGGSSASTKEGTYAVNITQLATQASYTGDFVVNTFPLTIDANNDNFSITIDGTSSGVLSITQGDYASGDDLATALQLLVNSSSLLDDANKTASVTYDSANGGLVFSSSSYGSESTLSFNSVDTNTEAQLGFRAETGSDGLNVEGTIGGVAGTGDGQTLSIETGDPSGISIDVAGSLTGSRGNIVFVRGFVESLDTLLESYLNDEGVISTREEALNDELDNVVDETAALNLRMDAVEARFIAQFTSLDILVSQFQATGNFLSSTLDNLPGFSNNDN